MNPIEDNSIDLKKLENTDPNFAEAIKTCVKEYLVAGTTNSADVENPIVGTATTILKRGKSYKGKSFQLNSLPRDIADALADFDCDGNGTVTIEEVQNGAKLLRKTRKNNKMILWAMVIQFVIYVLMTTALGCVIYNLLGIVKDLQIDTSTGNMMVKTNDGRAQSLEVTIKSKGTMMESDAVTFDSNMTAIQCFSADHAAHLFKTSIDGIQTRIASKDPDTGDLEIIPVGRDAVTWTENEIDLGSVKLYPSKLCTVELNGRSSDGAGRSRLLSQADLKHRFLTHRESFTQSLLHSHSNVKGHRRHLEDRTGDYAVRVTRTREDETKTEAEDKTPAAGNGNEKLPTPRPTEGRM